MFTYYLYKLLFQTFDLFDFIFSAQLRLVSLSSPLNDIFRRLPLVLTVGLYVICHKILKY